MPELTQQERLQHQIREQAAKIDQQQAEIERLRGLVHDCPECGESCVECRSCAPPMWLMRQKLDEARKLAQRIYRLAGGRAINGLAVLTKQHPWLEESATRES